MDKILYKHSFVIVGSLIASCKTACAQNEEEAELQSVRLALALASHTRKLLQQLDIDQLEKDVQIGVKTSSFNEELVDGRPIAMQLGLSRRNKHKQLRDQLQVSRVHPDKNLAQSLIHNASGKQVLAKLRINTGAAETLALSTVSSFASFVPSSSLVVGMVCLAPPMEKPQLRQLALSESCLESLSKNLADKSLASLTLPSLSLEKIDSESLTLCSLSLQMSKRDRFNSLTWRSLSLTEANLESLILDSWSFPTDSLTLYNLSRQRDRFQSLILQSLSLNDANGFQRISFKEVSFENGSLKELEEHIAHQHDKKRAETSSFSEDSFEKDQLAEKRAKTNSFSTHSLQKRILSLQMCLPIFLFWSFHLAGAALLLTNCSFRISLQPGELAAAYSRKSFDKQRLQQEELFIASSKMSFPQESMQQDELQLAYLHQLDLDASLSFSCFSLFGCSKGTLESFNQLDLAISLCFQKIGSISVSYQLQADSFHNISFELRASICAALLQTIRINTRQLQSFQFSDQMSFQLTGFQLSSALVSGGVQQKASQKQIGQQAWPTRTSRTAPTLKSLSLANWIDNSKRALRRRTLSALTLHSLSLALSAWLKTPSKTAWRDIALRQSLSTTLSTTSSHRSASMRILQATSFRRLASASALTTPSLRTTSSFPTPLSCFSFLFNNFFFNNSFGRKEAEKKDELSKTFLELELEELIANKSCSLGPYDHLEQKLWQIQLQELSLQQNNQEQQNQPSATVPDRKLLQLYLSQLCQQDPDSTISRQLPEEPLSASGLRTAAWPAAVQIDNLSFSKKNLSEQDLSNISLDKFFPENFGTPLQNNQLQKNTFQQLSFEDPSLTEKILHKELATTFAKNSLIDNLVFQNFFFATLALQKKASEQLGENNLYKKQLADSSFTQTKDEACKDQLLTTGFSEASLNQQPFSNSLVQTSGAKAASQPELLRKELLEEQLADKNLDQNTLAATSLPTRPSTRQLQKDKLEEENFTENSFEALCLNNFPGTACTEALLPDQLLQQQLSNRNFHQDSFSASNLSGNSFRAATSQTAAFRRELSDRQLHRQQLDRNNLQHSSFEKDTFEKTSFKDKS